MSSMDKLSRSKILWCIVVLLGLTGLFLWLKSIVQPNLTDIAPPQRTTVAYCTGKIERVKVVNFVPGNLEKQVTLGELDPEFVKHARKTLGEFWAGEIVVVVTGNVGSVLPLSEREMTLGFEQSAETQNWSAFAFVYDEARLMGTLEYTAITDISQKQSNAIFKKYSNENAPDGFLNYNGGFTVARYDKEADDFYNFNDNFGKGPYPKLFVRSLKDLVAGRCDRTMSEAVHGPDTSLRKNVPLGQF